MIGTVVVNQVKGRHRPGPGDPRIPPPVQYPSSNPDVELNALVLHDLLMEAMGFHAMACWFAGTGINPDTAPTEVIEGALRRKLQSVKRS